MLKLIWSSKFKKDFKLCEKRGFDMALLENVIDTLRIPSKLPLHNRDHFLTGDYASYRECHIQPDWLLVYRVTGDELHLVRTGTHSDLF